MQHVERRIRSHLVLQLHCTMPISGLVPLLGLRGLTSCCNAPWHHAIIRRTPFRIVPRTDCRVS